MPAPPLYVARTSGTRYHSTPRCEGLTATEAAGHPIDALTRSQVLTRRLLPCALCQRAGMVQVPILGLVS